MFTKRIRSLKNFTQLKLIILTSIFLVLFDNYAFFKSTVDIYPIHENIAFLFSLGVVLGTLTTLLLILFSSKYTTKAILIIVVLVSSLTNYFMNTYFVVIDSEMIRNTVQTNMNELLDLLTLNQVGYFLFLGVLPSWFIYRSKIVYQPMRIELIVKMKVIVISLLIISGTVFIFSRYYTSFFREHKPLRYATNPTYWIYSIGDYINKIYNNGPVIVNAIGEDAKVVRKQGDKHKIVIVVVGEAARADHFSLNGYERETNPLLVKQDVINLSNVFSCGTSTAVSVPCMFSIYDHNDYSYNKGISTQNVLDVLSHTNEIAVLWRDNNSNSKGVALRVPFEDYRMPENNPICEGSECRDEGMLAGLDSYIDQHPKKDILIVLHQMGNHGPAYYKRYPKRFEMYTPVCETNQVEQCTQEEINNAYDNALLYTDYFLNATIEFLKKYDKTHATAMVYMSDHGESLGENGLYLHGLPYVMAPESQTHISALMWFNTFFNVEKKIQKFKKSKDKEYTHDNLFHTLLGLFNVQTSVYQPSKDILYIP
ncbi:phosphoethanolamine transferase [Sulfurovum zhangzhouensis]|nr:phosphoethanolamine--lipid A transferase [Sulfurovum zhangzhouensis]